MGAGAGAGDSRGGRVPPRRDGEGAGPKDPGGPKLFVKSDESWKAEAQREKERLAQEAAAQEARRELPPPSFAGFIGELGLQAMLALGLIEVEGPQKPKRDLQAARYTIDLLGILEEKTRGNLTPDEKRHLDGLLHSLRINYASAARAKE